MDRKFIITVDTEGDNIWKTNWTKNSMRRITTRNGAYILRFQELCEKYNFIPTYLVDYEMTQSQPFVEMSKSKLVEKKLEIGMHMHAWNCPPYYELIPKKRGANKPYIGEYPKRIIEKKVDYLTKSLEDIFQTDIQSHRSGRWYIDKEYIQILKRYGYLVDCSVTPYVNWIDNSGLTRGSAGVNYKKYPCYDYEMDLNNLQKKGKSGFYEVPVTIDRKNISWLKYDCNWLRPNGKNIEEMNDLVEKKIIERCDYLEFMIHSSELMPGGSSTFQKKQDIEHLYKDLDILFSCISRNWQGESLSGFVVKKYNLIKH